MTLAEKLAAVRSETDLKRLLLVIEKCRDDAVYCGEREYVSGLNNAHNIPSAASPRIKNLTGLWPKQYRATIS
jgi:hypothetical protein